MPMLPRLTALSAALVLGAAVAAPAAQAAPLPLTHQMVSELVGAQRPGVSVALSKLTTAGTLGRTEDRGWLLDPASENNHSG